MDLIKIQITEPWRQAFDQTPDALRRSLGRAVHRAAEEGAREAKREAPKAFSTLTQSIRALRKADLEYEVAAGTDYALMVEQGTGLWGPAGRPSGKLPPAQSLEDWIKRKRIVPDDPEMDALDLAHVLASSIAKRGTPARPFMGPAFKTVRGRAGSILQRELQRGLKEAGF